MWVVGYLLLTPPTASSALTVSVMALILLASALGKRAWVAAATSAVALLFAMSCTPTTAALALAAAIAVTNRRPAPRAAAATLAMAATWSAVPGAAMLTWRVHSGLVDLVGISRELGPSASFAPLVVLGALVAIAARGVSRWYRLALLLGVTGAWVVRLHHVDAALASDDRGMAAFGDSLAASGLLGVVSGILSIPTRTRVRTDLAPWMSPLQVSWALVEAAAAMLLFWGGGSANPDQIRVGFLNAGGLDWRVPEIGKFGSFDAGMFGLLPRYLEADGFDCTAVDARTPLADQLKDLDILCAINCHLVFDESQRGAIEGFVQNGGSVLALGDHTDVYGLQRGFNSWLADYGIEFEFDSAMHSRGSWGECVTALAAQPAFTAQPRFRADHAIGASLTLSGTARPLLVGAHSFSDGGEPENIGGAFLGNYSLDPGEAVGDLVLIAEAVHGRGRLVAYGDTSAFQNSGLGRSYGSHVLPVMTWLGRPAHWSERPICRWIACLAVLALAGSIVAAGSAGASTGMCALALATASIEHWHHSSAVLPKAQGAVFIDTSHAPEIGHYEASVNSIYGLFNAVNRVDLRSLQLDEFGCDQLDRARALISIAPTLGYTPAEVECIEGFVQRGGTLILAVDASHARAIASLLDRFGIAVPNRPLGPQPAHRILERDDSVPRFQSAWPVEAGPSSEALASVADCDIVARRQHGEGHVVVIGDSRFFSSQNVMGEWGYWPGNVRFIYNLLVRYCGGDEQIWTDERFAPPIAPE